MKRKLLLLSLVLTAPLWVMAQDMTATPLTLEAVEAGTISIINPNTLTIEYTKDGSTWTAAQSDPITISVTAGDVVQFRGDNDAYATHGSSGEQVTRFVCSNDCYLYGNIMSLISSAGFATLTTLPKVGGDAVYDDDMNFAYLFTTPTSDTEWWPTTNTTIKNHPTKDLVLPATHATRCCYLYMFDRCAGLTRAPKLPATTLGWGCYHRMFEGCTGLTEAPELPAAHVPNDGYSGMFAQCSNLNYVKCLATSLADESACMDWMTGTAATGTFVKAAGMNDWTVGPQDEWGSVNGIPAGWTVVEAADFDAHSTPLTFEATADETTVTIANPLALTIGYSTDGGTTWSTANTNPITISGIAAGGTVQLRADNAAYSNGSDANGSTVITFDKECYAYGNVMSLVSSAGFATATTLTAANTFYDLFYSNKQLKNHPTKALVLPATTLTDNCYGGMFRDCDALTVAPELPATTLAENCYQYMFYSCGVLDEAPALPATTLAPYCYRDMFGFCPVLTAAPALPATTLADHCYSQMFFGCKTLNSVSALPATTLAPYCYNEMYRQCQTLTEVPADLLPAKEMAEYGYRCMFQMCTALENAPALPATMLAEGCYLGMFVGNIMTAAPALPATTLAKNCYRQMFHSCSNLTAAPTLAAPVVAEGAYSQMFVKCSSLTSATIAATTVGDYSCEQMFQGCTALENAPALPATELANYCYNYMFSGCTALTAAPTLPAVTMKPYCYNRMFENCSSLVNAPELPATTLADLCYNDMFWNCTSLTVAPELPATTLADYCYTMMFVGCSSLEKAPVLHAATLTPGCYEHMFMNCSKLNYVKCLATDLGDETSTDGWLTNVAPTGTFIKAAAADWSGKGTTEGTWQENEGDTPVDVTYVHGIPAGWSTTYVYPFTVPSTGFDTFSAADKVTVPAGLTAYTCESFDATTATVSLVPVSGTVIPAATGVVMRGEAGAVFELEPTDDAAATVGANSLVAVTVATQVEPTAGDNTNFTLSGESFVKATDGGVMLPANKAYLQIPTASLNGSVSNIDLSWIDTPTAIQQPEAVTAPKTVYDLQGRKVVNPAPGLYIINGKKVYIR